MNGRYMQPRHEQWTRRVSGSLPHAPSYPPDGCRAMSCTDVQYKGVGPLGVPVPISGKSALLFSWRTIVADA